jgi:threonine/homoserine/homoserine lactone efflux protein
VKKTSIHSAKFQIQKLKGKDYLGIAGKGFLINFINIGVLGFWLGVIIVFGPSLEMNLQRLITFFSTVLITYLVIDVIKILLAKKLNKKLTPTRVAISKKIISMVLIIFGVVLLFRGIFPEHVQKFDAGIEEMMPSN